MTSSASRLMGGFIKHRRNEKGITQRGLAMALKTTPKTIINWERGHVIPCTPLLAHTFVVLEVDAETVGKLMLALGDEQAIS